LNESSYSQSVYLHKNLILSFLLNHRNLNVFWGSPSCDYEDYCFKDVTPCSMVEEYQHFTGACCPHYHTEVQFDFTRIMASHPRRCLPNRTLCPKSRGFSYL